MQRQNLALLILVFICPLVFTIIAAYFRKHIHLRIGKSGYQTAASAVSEEAWLYAQLICPKVYGQTAAALFLLGLFAVPLGLAFPQSCLPIAKFFCTVGCISVFVPFFIIDKKTEAFQKNFFKDKKDKNHASEREEWRRLTTFLIKEKRVSDFPAVLTPDTWKNLLREIPRE